MVLSFATACSAQDPPALAEARALNEHIQKLPDLPEVTRDAAFREMLQRIRKEPQQYRLTLASNLAVSAGEVAIDVTTLQKIANLLVEELRSNPGSNGSSAFKNLAEFAFYRQIHVSLDTPLYDAELAKLEDQARIRGSADFILHDTNGRRWHLKDLGGKVVLVNFWATWCAPCRREMADFQTMYNRFADQGFIILAVTGEDAATVKRYLADHPITFCVLLDPGDITRKQFLVDDLPHSLLYNREGTIIAQIPGPLTDQQLLDTLVQAGLK